MTMDCHQAHHKNLLTVNWTDGLSTGSISSTATVNIDTCIHSAHPKVTPNTSATWPLQKVFSVLLAHHMVHHPPPADAAAIDLVVQRVCL